MHLDLAAAAGFDLIGPPLRGGSGVVYRARERQSGDDVALKVLLPGVDIDRLEREASILQQVDHPNLARFRSLIQLGDEPALVTEWVDGRSLRELLHDGPLARDRAHRIFAQIAAALTALHASGIVHGDITPNNVLLRPDDSIALIDFGVSRSEDSATVTVDGSMAGTPRYLAPEVIEGAPRTPGSDQYAAGLLLHEMVSGDWPFPPGDSIATALHHQLHSEPVPLGELDTSTPPSWTDAVLRSLEKDPERRFGSVDAFLHALTATTNVSTLNRGRRLSFASLVFRVGLPLVLVAALIVPALREDDSAEGAPGTAATTIATTSTTTVEPSESTAPTTLEDRTAEPATTAEPLETVAPTTTDGADRVVVAAWESGVAESLACNLLTEADFETDDLPDNWFQDGDDPDREQVRVLADGGVEGSGVLQVGEPNLFGIWGEVVPVEAGRRYLFSANVRVEGTVFTSEMSVDWVDASFAQFGSSPSLDVIAAAPGQVTLITPPAPDGAAWAVPRTFKDNGEGLVFLDEMVFAAEGSDCDPLLRAE